jgi:hypothetical protein
MQVSYRTQEGGMINIRRKEKVLRRDIVEYEVDDED